MFLASHPQYRKAAMLLLALLVPLVSGCASDPQAASYTHGQSASAVQDSQVREYTYFTMGGIRIKMTGPEGYAAVPAASPLRQAVSPTLNPPENIFAVFLPVNEPAQGDGDVPQLMRGCKLVIVSARPEFMDEYVEPQFFQALRKDLQRVNGSFAADSFAHFRRLTETYYNNQDSFTHSLGVFHSTRYSLSMARIVREGGSAGEGAVSAYPENAPALYEGQADPLPGANEAWSREYFAGAYHKIQVQNVLLLGGRYFNIYFSAPLAEEADILRLMEENRRYMNLVAAAMRSGELNPDAGNGENDSAPSAVQKKRRELS